MRTRTVEGKFAPEGVRPSLCHPNRKHQANGLCKSCSDNSYPSAKVSKAKWQHKNHEQHSANNRRRRAQQYGITLEEYDAGRGGGCMICERTDRRMVADHDHQTNILRGFLCFMCNAAIGALGDSAELIEKAAKYVRSNGSVE